MKTIAYVDGYNLYYGVLRVPPANYKWLDLYSLFSDILKNQSPESELLCVKFYTAPILGKFSVHGETAVHAQASYHRALKSIHTGPVEIYEGYYTDTRSTPMRYKNPPDKTDKLDAWKLEEKQTDVNIALDIYRDACQEACDQMIVCTSDTDIVPALKYVSTDFPNIEIGSVLCRRNEDTKRPDVASIKKNVNWMRNYILEEELARNQFKDKVPTKKYPVVKPVHW